jgi:polyphosphate kinase
MEASERGKQVAVLVELKARFDEENNIEWARQLERAGVHVVYGLLGLKTHCKLALVVRRESDTLRRYVHIGTGNYNPATARLYTDLGLFTASEQVGADATDVFNYLTGLSRQTEFRRLLVAPVNMRERLTAMIEREVEHHKEGRPARIIAKTNSLTDTKIIRALYEASQAGVPIDLVVRGICALRPGVPGLSDTINVVSIVGRFLEHSRIFYFQNGGEEDVYIGSADWMMRNLDRRVEVLVPIEDSRIKTHLKNEVLEVCLSDNTKARRLLPDGKYERVLTTQNEDAVDAQSFFVSFYNAPQG